MNIVKNIQFQQLINLLLLLYISYINNLLNISIYNILLLSIFALLLETLLNYYLYNKIYFPYSALITTYGIVLMLAWSKWYIPYILIILAIMQKRFLKIENIHIFNPSNFAVIMALLLFFPKALPIMGQLSRDYFTIFLIIALGTIILIRVNRWLISFSFITIYTLLSYIIFKNIDSHWQFYEFLLKFYSSSFIVYIFFMLTDPVTTPNSNRVQILFGSLVALTALLLDIFTGMHIKNIFIALFLTSIASIPFYRKNFSLKYYIFLLIVSILISLYLAIEPSKYFLIS